MLLRQFSLLSIALAVAACGPAATSAQAADSAVAGRSDATGSEIAGSETAAATIAGSPASDSNRSASPESLYFSLKLTLFSPLMAAAPAVLAETEPDSDETVGATWLTSYEDGYLQAQREKKYLLIYFENPARAEAHDAFAERTLAQADQLAPDQFVFVRLPLNARVQQAGGADELRRHAAFQYMYGQEGVAIIDFRNDRLPESFGRVVSSFPFRDGKPYSAGQMAIVLTLPPGTITQRTMVYAVRMHPEAPKSTHGHLDMSLAREAQSHSQHQASIGVQGHHSWESRFHRINAKMGHGLTAQEVCAESWPNYTLVEACVDCVHSWRQSSGHWNAVQGMQNRYGYDIKRGRNGIWYATGIFGRLLGRG